MRARLLPAIALAFAAGCDDDPVEPLDFDVTITTSVASATVGQSVVATVDVQGNYLLSLELDWGDGESIAQNVDGARTARWTPAHAYSEPGTYTVRVTVEELTATISRTATVTVTAAGAR